MRHIHPRHDVRAYLAHKQITVTAAAEELGITRVAMSRLLHSGDISMYVALGLEQAYEFSALGLLTQQLEYHLAEARALRVRGERGRR